MNDQVDTIAVAATFTAEPLEEVLTFWTHELDIPAKITFAAYNQVFQQLLDPTSLLARNRAGLNVILVRVEDWLRPHDLPPEQARSELERHLGEFVLALRESAARTGAPHLVCLCPSAPETAADPRFQGSLADAEARLAAEISALPNVYIVTTQALAAGYPVEQAHDPYSNALGHIPYTPAFFTALGTMIARTMNALRSAPYKVVVLDCDQTLWGGVCGEDGTHGVRIDAPHRALHDFVLKQQAAGRLICLCSKNNLEDVVEVFTQRQELGLRWDDLTAWQINWRPKSENLRSLAAELGLGLESFIFIDDSALECAEVRSRCPEVLTLQLPDDPAQRVRFLEHVWAFDSLKVTEEDTRRAHLYQQERQREQYRAQALTLGDFLAGLELEVRFFTPEPAQLGRVAQLTRRTNQFNLTTIRRSAGEIEQLCRSGALECRAVQVRDRFGDYGLVGVILFEAAAAALRVDTLLLSCRALGRGVEQRMLAWLGAYALEHHRAYVELPYAPSAKNQPARDFLESAGATYREPSETGFTFRFPATFAAALTYQAGESAPSAAPDAPQAQERGPATADSGARQPAQNARLLRIATDLYDAQQIRAAIEARPAQPQQPGGEPPAGPQTALETELAAIWARTLRVDRVDVHSNFFASGGDSLLGTRLLLRVRDALQVSLSLDDLFKAPTVAQMGALIEAQRIEQATEEELAAWLHELDGLSDDQVQALLSAENL